MESIWYFRDYMLESGCEINASNLNSWLSHLSKHKYIDPSIGSTDLSNNSLLPILLSKVRPTVENNIVLNNFAIKLKKI